ncbi:hypothetical protein GSI_02303 [Ganoderma sinense ZZ0214-1]|uniref:Uncharacterized protein n=1 Tax=Ganoderma sinense ZZ0214-1 TaxID=1077348 RepID=A0A2G8SP83_9APHY|nr:hypothetical protein GSI_02303 [Ganoderma sinense ZZ0214-1]
MFGFFSSRSCSQTAAALHAKILDRTNAADAPPPTPRVARHVVSPGLLNALLGLPEPKSAKHFADVKFVAPSAFYQPKPRPSLTGILSWQDQTEQCSPQSNTSATRKSIIKKILLVAGRRRAEIEDPNAAPVWPPIPELIANPPNRRPRPQAIGLPVPPIGLGLDIALPIASTVSSGHFIGRDGTEWPLPPTECMPRPSLSPIAPPRTLPALTPLGGDKWTTLIATLDTVEDKDAPFFASLHMKHSTRSCSTVATSLPRTPTDEVVLLPVRNAKVECAPRWGVIGDGRPRSKPEPASPPRPFLGASLRLPSPSFMEAEDIYDEDGEESVIGYWSESESEFGSEYSEFEDGDDDAWSINSVYDSDSEVGEGDSRSDFFLASDEST